MRSIKCEEDVWGEIINVITTQQLDAIENDGSLPLGDLRTPGDFATAGLKEMCKYYVLNKVAKDWGIDIDPELPIEEILTILNYQRKKISLRKLDKALEKAGGKNA